MSGKHGPHRTRLNPDLVAGLLGRAEEAAKRAYAPYSGLHIGAALLTADGGLYQGCNVENASYGLTWCAERTAVVSAVAAEGALMRIEAIAIWTDDLPVSPPCGACRQVLAEFGRDTVVVFNTTDGMVERTVGELLPDAFVGPID